MRDIRNAPLFLRLGARLRGPKDITVGTLKRVIVRGIPEEGGSGHNLFPADVPVREPRSRVADAERPHSSGIPALRLETRRVAAKQTTVASRTQTDVAG